MGLAGAAWLAARPGRRPRARLIDGLDAAEVRVVADTAYQGAGQAIRVRSVAAASIPTPAATGGCPAAQKDVNAAHARQRGPGERANAQLKSWKILRRSAAARAEQRAWSRP